MMCTKVAQFCSYTADMRGKERGESGNGKIDALCPVSVAAVAIR